MINISLLEHGQITKAQDCHGRPKVMEEMPVQTLRVV